ncbi:L-seryl-tRNA(Sec) selenium transferase [Pseudalkalibacillus caeni]|uniref:L-seryl-tRNA(Sec) selenium transferase n=1 Tax=Exobacillus caeni TaxID=2574798 RepID=A0A5R9F730_9BACL|nr:L-seryl-tRNA(Sec) selenium transferase [Pseudalkalibacillus caeni]TLS37438.1 L-seryl-tRNA(Sec) selenium transferase [Pseudalkalibacillus caeni]
MKHLLRELPPIHQLQSQLNEMQGIEKLPTEVITKILQEELEKIRTHILKGEWEGPEKTRDEFKKSMLDTAKEKAFAFNQTRLKQVINATGVVLHTNLGRARLGKAAVKSLIATAESYSNLEYKLETGDRGSRHSIIESLICEVAGSEAAMVVNNNAAAVYLILSALAKQKEVIVSRGELVEIGGSFRISSIMEESGACLVEVGTTNKTHLFDYERAITEDTSMVMKVHRSNFSIIGFTKEVGTAELADLSSQYEEVLFYEDLGSGALYDFKSAGIGNEPVVSEVIKAGADLVSFSGDKLLGGPQAGIIAGRRSLIERLKKHQLARVLRVDKFTLSALEATLKEYVKGSAAEEIPTVRDILASEEAIKQRAGCFVEELKSLNKDIEVSLGQEDSKVGGGTMPDVRLPTFVVEIKHSAISSKQLADRLRKRPVPIICRIKDEKALFDLRTVNEEETGEIITALKEIL